MGMTAAIVGGALLGLGASSFFGGRQSTPNFGSYSSTPYQSAVSTLPTMPEAPAVDDSGNQNTSMLAAEEEERKKRAAQAEANQTNFTGGLGLTNPANVQRKTLLG